MKKLKEELATKIILFKTLIRINQKKKQITNFKLV